MSKKKKQQNSMSAKETKKNQIKSNSSTSKIIMSLTTLTSMYIHTITIRIDLFIYFNCKFLKKISSPTLKKLCKLMAFFRYPMYFFLFVGSAKLMNGIKKKCYILTRQQNVHRTKGIA